jgi:DNA-binding SARP family transcriptional activator
MRSIFHTTLYRARHALGENVIIFEHEVYLINPDLSLWCDAHEALALARRAQMLPTRDARAEDLWRRAVELMRGDFLPSLFSDWVLPLRDTMHETYLDALRGLAECSQARRDYRGALGLLKRALTLEPYREDMHRAVLLCYADLGEKQQIAAHFDAMVALFRKDLGLEPSEETLRLARRLLH